MLYTRRDIGKMALTASAATLVPDLAFAQKPNSKINGVQIGMNVPYNFGNAAMGADEILQRCLQLKVSAVEMRARPVEAFMGLPVALQPPAGGARGANAAEGREQRQAAEKTRLDGVRDWRLKSSMDSAKQLRTTYEDAGVLIEIVKFDGVPGMSDEEIDWGFTLAKTLGARVFSCEISLADVKRMAPIAEKHRMMIGYHNHAEITPAVVDDLLSNPRYVGFNLDIGHFVAGNSTSPMPLLRKHHERITHLHIKDRKMNGGPNTPFGQGDTPIGEVLRAIRDNKWNIQATIEFEYPVPAGSDRMAELAKTVEFCTAALRA